MPFVESNSPGHRVGRVGLTSFGLISLGPALFGLGLAVAFGLGIAPAALAASPGLHAEEIVRFPSHDSDVTGGAPTRLTGRFLRPDGGEGPYPTVVLLHGCSGLYARSTGRLSPRILNWALTLREQGYAVLMVDSFKPRGVEEVCTQEARTVRASVERKRDARAALDYLHGRRDVDGGRIGLMGWSQGAGTVLATYRGDADEEEDEDGAMSGYRAAIALYPGCRASLSDESWRPDGPLLLLLGGKDDWTPPGPCLDLAKRDTVKGRTQVIVYPDARHGFDSPALPVKTWKNLARLPAGEATVGTDEDARADAIDRVTSFLAAHLRG